MIESIFFLHHQWKSYKNENVGKCTVYIFGTFGTFFCTLFNIGTFHAAHFVQFLYLVHFMQLYMLKYLHIPLIHDIRLFEGISVYLRMVTISILTRPATQRDVHMTVI